MIIIIQIVDKVSMHYKVGGLTGINQIKQLNQNYAIANFIQVSDNLIISACGRPNIFGLQSSNRIIILLLRVRTTSDMVRNNSYHLSSESSHHS